jgi:hypothetical protein
LPQDLISSPSALPLFNEVDRYLDANDDDCNWQDLELEEEIEQSKKKRALAAARLEKAKAEIQMAASDKPRSVIYSFMCFRDTKFKVVPLVHGSRFGIPFFSTAQVRRCSSSRQR